MSCSKTFRRWIYSGESSRLELGRELAIREAVELR